MAHEHKLEILRGLVKFKSNIQKIWGVLILLSIITTVEVVLGIYKHVLPDFFSSHLVGMKVLNWIFIILTIVKAYYITWDFMHMRDEVSNLKKMVVWTAVFLICYLVFILLQEGSYSFNVYHDGYIKHDF